MRQIGYNGWKNHATWNVALWIGNDESIYEIAKGFKTYKSFLRFYSQFSHHTPDGVAWNDSALDVGALNRMIRELD